MNLMPFIFYVFNLGISNILQHWIHFNTSWPYPRYVLSDIKTPIAGDDKWNLCSLAETVRC